jgi:hypothetical protein
MSSHEGVYRGEVEVAEADAIPHAVKPQREGLAVEIDRHVQS